MDCPICQATHPLGVMCSPRLKTIFTSSTLHNAWTADSWKGTDGFHVDFESICGGKIAMGKTLWELTYADLSINIDTHVAMGLNDLLAMIRLKERNDKLTFISPTPINEQVKQFMAPLESWYNLTVQHAVDHNLATPNRFSVSSLIRAPQLYYFPGNRGKMLQTWPTHNDLIDAINREIYAFNGQINGANGEGQEGSSYLNLAKLGNRKSTQGLRQHTGVQWREIRPDQKLHLGSSLQVKGFKMCVDYLREHTPNELTKYND